MKSLLRAIFSIPAGYLSGLVAMFPLHWLVLWLTRCQRDGMVIEEDGCSRGIFGAFPPETLERVGYGIVTPAMFVWAASSVFPGRSKWIPVIFAALWWVFVTIVFTNIFTSPGGVVGGRRYGYEGAGWVEFGFLITFHLATSVITAKILYDQRRKAAEYALRYPPAEEDVGI